MTEPTTRTATINRNTNETKITVTLSLDGTGHSDIATGIGFFDHMLTPIARHGFFDLSIKAEGDLHIDCHHTIEDVGIVLGQAFNAALGKKEGIRRYGSSTIPMDEALVLCAVDVSGRPFLGFDCMFTTPRLGELDTEMIREFFRAFSVHAGVTLHIKMLDGENNHHIAEAAFKAFARALSEAVARDGRVSGALSTKGMIDA